MNIRNNLQCYLCFGKANKARICSNCKKIACEKCLITMINKTGKCQNCQKETSIDQMIALPFMEDLTSYFINSIESHKKNDNVNNNYQNNNKDEEGNVELNENMNRNQFCEKHKDKIIEYYCLECSEYLCSKCLVFFNQKSVDKHKNHKIVEIENLNKFNINEAIEEYSKLNKSKNDLKELKDKINITLMELDLKKTRNNKILEEIKKDMDFQYIEHIKKLNDLVNSISVQIENIDNSIYSVPNSFNNIVEKHDYGQGQQILEQLKKLNEKFNVNNKEIAEKVNIKNNFNFECFESEYLTINIPNNGEYLEELNILDKDLDFIPNHKCKLKIQFLGGNIIFTLSIEVDPDYYREARPKFNAHIYIINPANKIEFSDFYGDVYANGVQILSVETFYDSFKEFLNKDNNFQAKFNIIKCYYK